MRVHQVTPDFDYRQLVQSGEVPELTLPATAYARRRHPPWLYRGEGYQWMGLIVDFLCRQALRHQCVDAVAFGSELDTNMAWTQYVYVALEYSEALLGRPAPFTRVELVSYIPTLQVLFKAIVAQYQQVMQYVGNSLIYNAEVTSDFVCGHPDIVTDDAIFEIKFTTNFEGMLGDACLQLLAYAAMYQTRYIGFILPLQQLVVLWDCEYVSLGQYLQRLNGQPVEVICPEADAEFDVVVPGMGLTQHNSDLPIGGHLVKGMRTFVDTLQTYVIRHDASYRPIQMFLRAQDAYVNNGGLDNITLNTCRNLVSAYRVQLFIHMPFTVNTAVGPGEVKYDRKTGRRKADQYTWTLELMRINMTQGVLLGAKGVVMHTGDQVGRVTSVATDNMEANVRDILAYATETCPLLIETSAGEAGELCYKLDDLVQFCNRFTPTERRCLGLCVDSAHVWGAGYVPTEFVRAWCARSSIPIRLMHFNDSAVAQGSHIDKHATPGFGHIGYEEMARLADWCVRMEVPMVVE